MEHFQGDFLKNKSPTTKVHPLSQVRVYRLETDCMTIPGKVSNPNGGWIEVTGHDSLPNPTNKQNSRLLRGWSPSVPVEARETSRPRALGDLFRQNGNKPSEAELRCRSVGRQSRQPPGQASHSSLRERSLSPAEVRRGRRRGALGDCFMSGVRPSQQTLRPAGRVSPAPRRQAWRRESEERESLTDQMMNHIRVHQPRQNSVEMEDWDDQKCLEIEQMPDFVSSEDKVEAETNYNIRSPSGGSRDRERPFQNEFSQLRQYPIRNIVQASHYQDTIPHRTSTQRPAPAFSSNPQGNH